MRIVALQNLTPHPIIIVTDRRTVRIEPSGEVARLAQSEWSKDGEVAGIPVVTLHYGEITGLPEPKPGTGYIVSNLVLTVVGDSRLDVFAPDTGPSAIRDGDGQVVAVRRLIRGWTERRHHDQVG